MSARPTPYDLATAIAVLEAARARGNYTRETQQRLGRVIEWLAALEGAHGLGERGG